jgi:hypothetical protein
MPDVVAAQHPRAAAGGEFERLTRRERGRTEADALRREYARTSLASTRRRHRFRPEWQCDNAARSPSRSIRPMPKRPLVAAAFLAVRLRRALVRS